MKRKAGPLALTAILYFTVSGGPYGIEPLIAAVGAGTALVLLLIVPLVWAAPTALMVAELSAALPCQGGFYRWVDRAMGRFWAFQEGWWSWACSLPDMAIYPVLFGAYLGGFLQLSPAERWVVSLIVIWACTLLNVLGIRAVGAAAVLAGILVVVPFGLFSLLGIAGLGTAPAAASSSGAFQGAGFLVGLSVVLWNYTGWDNISLVGDEVDRPERTFPIALCAGLALIVVTYVLPVIAGLRVAPSPSEWTDGSFPVFARRMPGGEWLAPWILTGALVSTFTLYNSLLLSYARLPMVMAGDGFLPARFQRTNTRGVPVASVVVLSLFASAFALVEYERLVVLYGLVYTLSIILEFLALWILRVREPDLPRPFRIPGGKVGLILTMLPPLGVALLTLVMTLVGFAENPIWTMAALAVSLAGVPIYLLIRKRELH